MTRKEWIDTVGGALVFLSMLVGLPYALLAFGLI